MSTPHIGKGALARRMAARLGIPAQECEDRIESVLAEIRLTLAHGEGVTIQGFGAWKLRHQPAREGKIGSGEDALTYATPAKTVCKFTVAAELALEVATGNREGE